MLHITKTTTTKDTKSVSLPSMTNKTKTTETANQNGSNVAQPIEMKMLHDRVTTLEQELCNYKIDVKRLTMIINKLSIANLRERSGTLVWTIDDFEKKVQIMLANPMTMFYSPDLYTDPYGYRFCGRISISTKAKVKDTIGMHVHMMQSGCYFVHASFNEPIPTLERISELPFAYFIYWIYNSFFSPFFAFYPIQKMIHIWIGPSEDVFKF